MFKKLFGSSKPKQEAKPQLDPHETIDKLNEQIENIKKRIKKVEVDMKNLTTEALEKKKQKD